MRWERIGLVKMEQTGIDELENPVMQPVVYNTVKARVMPWTSDDLKLEDREVTKNSRRLVTPARFEVIDDAEKVDIGGVQYDVTGKRRYGRMRALIVEGYHG